MSDAASGEMFGMSPFTVIALCFLGLVFVREGVILLVKQQNTK